MGILSAEARKKLPGKDFAVAGRRFPIPDKAHARNALARASGKPEQAQVSSAVHRKFPGIGKE